MLRVRERYSQREAEHEPLQRRSLAPWLPLTSLETYGVFSRPY